MPRSVEQYRALITRIERVCQQLDASPNPRHRQLGHVLLATAANMDGTLRRIEWGCPPDRPDTVLDQVGEMLESQAAVACITELLAAGPDAC